MPLLAEQHTQIQGFTAVFTVLRLLTPLKMSYEAAKRRAQPYTKIVEELPVMRRDTVELVRRAITENRNTYVLVNNRAEGNAPVTVQALTEMLRELIIGQLQVTRARDEGLYLGLLKVRIQELERKGLLPKGE
jgi:hypothetical protein